MTAPPTLPSAVPLPRRPSAVLFDLDGTISESGVLIVATVRDALAEAGLPVPPAEALRGVVGPPLAIGLPRYAGVPADRVEEVVTRYRRLLLPRLAEAPAYKGMLDLVRALAADGIPLATATSKAQPVAEAVVAAYGLQAAFVAVCGDDPDEPPPPSKATVIRRALGALTEAGVDVRDAVMVGDRIFDVDSAAECGLAAIAVAWGYGTPQEWVRASAVAHTVSDLDHMLRGHRRG